MLKIRHVFILLGLLLSSVAAAAVQVSIGINVSAYPQLVRVPGYPVYYAPQLQANFFFYDGLYWVYQADNWYASSWYNGPWDLVDSEIVPVFIPTSVAGTRMHRRAGVITGAEIGNTVEAVGTNGTGALPRHLRPSLSTSGSIQGIAIPDKWSSSRSCNNSITVTSRVTPSCGNALRSG